MLEKLFESLDANVFTDEVKSAITAEVNEAITDQANIVAQERIDEEVEALTEKAEEFKSLLETQLKEEYEAKEKALLENVDAYLNKVVENFVNDATEKLEESIKTEKADLIIEAFEAMLIATGVEVASIVESKKEKDDSIEASLESKYNAAIEENIALEKENAELLRVGLINEMKEGLSLVESEKFEKLAQVVEFTKSEKYAQKLETIKESILAQPIDTEYKEDEKVEKINEEVDSKDKATNFSHLI